ncbi:hypothetical protein [Cellulomonas sp. H30R-01]|uniref:hypothetical protein n=1 Tax=Cellulomonas sp. H30R-01 TaxID=2704467 RepID=UPI00192EBEA8|nr:hypothetical protein [Cellulomonas sp. H30R-01]
MPDDAPRTWTVDDHLRDADPAHVELWHRVVALVEACGPVTVHAHRTTVTFAEQRRGFTGARPTRHGVDGFLDLQRPSGRTGRGRVTAAQRLPAGRTTTRAAAAHGPHRAAVVRGDEVSAG